MSVALEATPAAPTPVAVKTAAADENDKKNDEKDFHVRLQCGGTTFAGRQGSCGIGPAVMAQTNEISDG
jgi:hypothetical protein